VEVTHLSFSMMPTRPHRCYAILGPILVTTDNLHWRKAVLVSNRYFDNSARFIAAAKELKLGDPLDEV